MNIQELKDKGYKISIKHYRGFKLKVKGRFPHKRLLDEKLVFLPHYHKKQPGFALQTKGGYTTLSLFTKLNPDSSKWTLYKETISLCSENDVYCYKSGLEQCLNQLTNNI